MSKNSEIHHPRTYPFGKSIKNYCPQLNLKLKLNPYNVVFKKLYSS